MRVAATALAAGNAIAPTDLIVVSGAVTVVATETEQGPTVLSLLFGGRLRPSAGTIETDVADLRRAVAIVDAPDISAPPTEVLLASVVAEELMLAGHSSKRSAVGEFLRRFDAEELGTTPMKALAARIRLTVLTELALLRPGIDALVITSPERHGGAACDWWEVAQSAADRDIAVLVVTSVTSATAAAAVRRSTVLLRRHPSHRRTYTESPRP